MRQTTLFTTLLLAAHMGQASTIMTTAQTLSTHTPNGRKIATMNGRLYTVFVNGTQVQVASTADGANWALSTSIPLPLGLTPYTKPTSVIAADSGVVSVVFQSWGRPYYAFCTPNTTGVCTTWNGPYDIGTGGYEPSMVAIKGQLHIVWRDHHTLRYLNVPVGSLPYGTVITLANIGFGELVRQPAIAGYWDATAAKARVSVFWVRGTFFYGPAVWELRRADLTASNTFQHSVRATFSAEATDIASVAAVANPATAAFTYGVSVKDKVNGERTLVFNNTSYVQINSTLSYLSLDPYGLCGPEVRVAVGPLGGQAWRRDINQSTLAWINSQINFSATSFDPVAVYWLRNAGSFPNMIHYRVDGIAPKTTMGPNEMEAVNSTGSGWPVQMCAAQGPMKPIW